MQADHHRVGDSRATAPTPGRVVRSSHDALQVREVCLRLRTDSAAAGLHARHQHLLEEAQFLRARSQHVLADKVEARAERVLRELEDLATPPILVVADGEGLVELPAVTRSALAAWLYDTPAPITDPQLDALLDTDQRTRLDLAMRAFAGHYRAQRALDEGCNAAGAAETRFRLALSAVLEAGLRRRLDGGRVIGPERAVYLHLIARGFTSSALRVCASCARVFRTSRARTCASCRRSPMRPKRREWHQAVHAGDRSAFKKTSTAAIQNRDGSATIVMTVASPRTRARTVYVAACVECGRSFEASDARVRYCSDCASGKARTARSRRRR
jgi:hypothetical protein